MATNLPPPSMRFGLPSVQQYYEKIVKLPNSKFKFNFVCGETVLKLLKDLYENKTAGLDNLSGKVLKGGATILAKPISKICNVSINYSVFLCDCKITKLKPLIKKGSKTAPKNYRPISLLLLVSKSIDKVIHDQWQGFLDKNNIIYRYQSGFRKFFPTDSCPSHLNNKIATGFESGFYTDMILIDLQTFFDTVNHHIVLKKLGLYDSLEKQQNGLNLETNFSEPGNLLC